MKNIAVLQSFQSNIKKRIPIDIIYKPTKHVEIEPLCYFSEDISKAYSSSHSKGKKVYQENTKSINVFIAINLLLNQDKKGTLKIAQEHQE